MQDKTPNATRTYLKGAVTAIGLAAICAVSYFHPIDPSADGAIARAVLYGLASLLAGYGLALFVRKAL